MCVCIYIYVYIYIYIYISLHQESKTFALLALANSQNVTSRIKGLRGPHAARGPQNTAVSIDNRENLKCTDVSESYVGDTALNSRYVIYGLP
jgi:secreted trypsin-like serine protease